MRAPAKMNSAMSFCNINEPPIPIIIEAVDLTVGEVDVGVIFERGDV